MWQQCLDTRLPLRRAAIFIFNVIVLFLVFFFDLILYFFTFFAKECLLPCRIFILFQGKEDSGDTAPTD